MSSYRDLVNRFSTTSPGRFLVRHVASRVDPYLYHWSRGRVTVTGRPTVPQLVLVHTGARTGATRRTQLAYTRDGEDRLVVGSNMGSDRAPAWVHNLDANPDALIELEGQAIPVRAIRCGRDETAALWPRLDATVPQYAVYRTLTDREIPVFRLRRR